MLGMRNSTSAPARVTNSICDLVATKRSIVSAKEKTVTLA